MNVRVAGHQVETGEALQAHVSSRVVAITSRYFDRAAAASVTFGRGPHDDFTCDIVAPVTNGVVLKASGRASDAHVAFEGAADKIERQLSRYVSRLRNHKGNGAEAAIGGTDLVEDAGYTIFAATSVADEPPLSPPVIAETKVDIPAATVSDAVMMLDLRNTNALMFRNLASGAFNMVYRRDDGTIGWVEPQA
ncbi:MAG: ribosome-associated translation inhibitor RaiA [Sphingomonas bacterium]|nr:ribosome-associated translation inhibitor RaiA [Sphingomonas bacterium]